MRARLLVVVVMALVSEAWAAAPALQVDDRCTVTKPLKMSAEPKGRGMKTKLNKGAVLKVSEIEKRWALVMLIAGGPAGAEAPPEGYLKLAELGKGCKLLPPEPAAATAAGATAGAVAPADPGASGDLDGLGDLTFGGASGVPVAPTIPQAPAGTHACDYANVAECTEQCDLGHAVSCFSSAEQHRAGLPAGAGEEEQRRVVTLYTRACNRGHATGCVRLAEMYQRGEGVPVDDRVIRELFEKGCGMGDGLGCTNLGYIYYAGDGVAADPKRAAALYGQGCLAGNEQGCIGLGSLFQAGQGVPQDLGKAATLFRRGCDGDPVMGAKGCANLAYLFELGQGVALDRRQSIDLYRRGCAGGEDYACQRLDAHGVARPDPIPPPAATTPDAGAAPAAGAPPP